jgi:ribosomal protein S18 acetylase RimI-like enzyme
MEPATIRTVKPDEREHVVPTVVLAFATDPLVRWIWPDARAYLMNMPKLIDAFAGGAFTHDSAYATDDLGGAALWLPPGVVPDGEAMGALVQSTAPPTVLADLPELSQQMASYHPAEPHWYLPLIGVDPARQGQGYGAALMKHVTTILDRAGSVAYLESTNPRNISLYERHGFEALGRIQAGGSPPIVPMVRRPS